MLLSNRFHFYSKKGGKVKFEDFLQIMYKHQEDPLKEILEAFRVSDTQNRGFIMANEFRHIMTRFGERLSDKEGEPSWKVKDC